MARLFCNDHGCYLPESDFHPSNVKSRVQLCREHFNQRRRERHKRNPVPALVAESRAATGTPSIDVNVYKTVVAAHGHRCFISGAAGDQRLVLLRTIEHALPHERNDPCALFVPVLRKYSHAPCLWEPHLGRFEKWAIARSVVQLRERRGVAVAAAPAAPPIRSSSASAHKATADTPGGAGLVCKGRERLPPREDLERMLVAKCVEFGMDPTHFYYSLLLQQGGNA